MVQEMNDQQFWQEYTADMLGAIHYCLTTDPKKPHKPPKLYSDIAHPVHNHSKTDSMDGKQIVAYISAKL